MENMNIDHQEASASNEASNQLHVDASMSTEKITEQATENNSNASTSQPMNETIISSDPQQQIGGSADSASASDHINNERDINAPTGSEENPRKDSLQDDKSTSATSNMEIDTPKENLKNSSGDNQVINTENSISSNQEEKNEQVNSNEVQPKETDSNPQNNNETQENKEENSNGKVDKVISEIDMKIIYGNMEKIEKEFQDLKEKFFSEKIEALEKELERIKNAQNDEFNTKCKQLEEIKNQKIWASQKWKEYQISNIEAIVDNDKKLIDEEYKQERRALKDKMLHSTVDKKKRLLDEKTTMNLSDSFPNGMQDDKVNTRTTRSKRGKESISTTSTNPTNTNSSSSSSFLGNNNLPTGNYKESLGLNFKKQRLNPPNINYTLRDLEISEDLSLLATIEPLLPSKESENINNNQTNGETNNSPNSNNSRKSNTLNNNSSVYSDKGKLFYHNSTIEKGTIVTIDENPSSASSNVEGSPTKWIGTLINVSPHEIQLRSNDGTKSRFSLTALRNGRYTLTLT